MIISEWIIPTIVGIGSGLITATIIDHFKKSKLSLVVIVAIFFLISGILITKLVYNPLIKIPDVLYKSQDEAELILNKKKLNIEIIEEWNEQVNRHIIFFQDPQVGIFVKKYSTVSLKVSKGKNLQSIILDNSLEDKINDNSKESQSKSNIRNVRHYRIGIVDLNIGLTNLKQIAQQLNKIQHFFHFTTPKFPSVKMAIEVIDGEKNLSIYKIPSIFYSEYRYSTNDLILCVSRYPLSFIENGKTYYNYFAVPSDEDERFMFISSYEIYQFSKEAERSFEEGIVYLFIGQIVFHFTDTGYHEETRGCIMDFCKIRSNIIKGLKNRKFCEICSKKIKQKDLRQAIEAILTWRYLNLDFGQKSVTN